MGEIKNYMMNLEDIAADAARDEAGNVAYNVQDFMHEQRDMVRESIEINLLDYIGDGDPFDMDDFFSYMGFRDEDDYLTWLDETASNALAEEGLGDFV